MWWVVNATPRPLYPRESDPVRTVQEAGWAPGPVWTGAENIAHTGIRSPERPARKESVHRLRYPGPLQDSVPTEIRTGNNLAMEVRSFIAWPTCRSVLQKLLN